MANAVSYASPPPRKELELTTALQQVLAQTSDADAPKVLTLGLVIETTRERAFGVLMAFLCLPFLTPIPLPGVSIPFGIALMLLGSQIAIRKHRPWLPARLLRWKIPPKFGGRLIGFVSKLFRPLEKIIRPRLLVMQNPVPMVVVGIALAIDGIFLTILPAFPGSNLIPAWMALIKILGITEKDGMSLVVGSVLSYAGLIASIVGIVMGWQQIAARF